MSGGDSNSKWPESMHQHEDYFLRDHDNHQQLMHQQHNTTASLFSFPDPPAAATDVSSLLSSHTHSAHRPMAMSTPMPIDMINIKSDGDYVFGGGGQLQINNQTNFLSSFSDYLQQESIDYSQLAPAAFDITPSTSNSHHVFAAAAATSASADGKNMDHRYMMMADPVAIAAANYNFNNINASSPAVAGGVVTPLTANSLVSSSSSEAAGEEDSAKCNSNTNIVTINNNNSDDDDHDHLHKIDMEEEDQQAEKKQQIMKKQQLADVDQEEKADGGTAADTSKKVNKPRKKGEKRQREPRFAFMTKSEVDHLEDGYRWRKYGQKAVKNSPYPRSYYRCTTQKCAVKKRVERSYQEPSIVITTYEGQHTHQSPATIRGSSHLLAPPPLMLHASLMHPQDRHRHLLMGPLNSNSTNNQKLGINPAASIYLQNLASISPTLQQQQGQLTDYGLLQDIVPSSFTNSNLLP